MASHPFFVFDSGLFLHQQLGLVLSPSSYYDLVLIWILKFNIAARDLVESRRRRRRRSRSSLLKSA